MTVCRCHAGGRHADAVAGGTFPVDNHASNKPRHAHRIVLDAPCIQIIPLLPLMIRVAPFAD
jgi:hypothetical protein